MFGTSVTMKYSPLMVADSASALLAVSMAALCAASPSIRDCGSPKKLGRVPGCVVMVRLFVSGKYIGRSTGSDRIVPSSISMTTR